MDDLVIIFSLISLGFFGGFGHCIGMCGPFVFTQLQNRLEKIPLEKFSKFEKLKNFALLPYHFGRITTYSIIGFFCSIITKNIRLISGFDFIAALFLLIASTFFMAIIFEKKLSFKLGLVKTPNFISKLKPILSFLFKDPKNFKGYLLGLILGFIPCGLLYGAFALSATIANPFFAALGMFCFGLATFPSLFLGASGSYLLFKFDQDKIRLIAKFVALINVVMLFMMAIKMLTNV